MTGLAAQEIDENSLNLTCKGKGEQILGCVRGAIHPPGTDRRGLSPHLGVAAHHTAVAGLSCDDYERGDCPTTPPRVRNPRCAPTSPRQVVYTPPVGGFAATPPRAIMGALRSIRRRTAPMYRTEARGSEYWGQFPCFR